MRLLTTFAFLLSAIGVSHATAALTELTGAARVQAGNQLACVLTSAGGVKCWGVGYGSGANLLGDGSTGGRTFAGDVSGLETGVSSIAVSGAGSHACAVLDAGGVRCWGSNTVGQLGNGSTADYFSPNLYPVDVVALGGPVAQVAAGAYHTCARLASGIVKCWGDNGLGQLGDGTTTIRLAPTEVAGLADVIQVVAGPMHTCALQASGAVRCWGHNGAGDLGDGTTVHRSTPVDVQSLASGVLSLAAGGTIRGVSYQYSGPLKGGGHTCAAMASGGMKCWGANDTGQVGDGLEPPADRLVPFDVTGLSGGIAAASAGGTMYPHFYRSTAYLGQTCARPAGGGLKCWGSDFSGWLHDGATRACTFPSTCYSAQPVDVIGSSDVSDVSVGAGYTCAVVAGGAVRCWGLYYQDESGAVPIMEGQGTQTITGFNAPNSRLPVGDSWGLYATASSGLFVSFSSLTPGICSVAGTTVTGISQGICEVGADQAGSSSWMPAVRVVVEFPVGDPVAQSITFGPAPSVTVNGVGIVGASASSGLPVSFGSTSPGICSVSGNEVTGLAVGSCTVVASQGGNALYAAAPQVTQTFPVSANTGTRILRVTRAGKAVGSVESTPPGINCPPACAGNFANGSTVALTPTPGADSYFAGWGGDCSGEGACSVAMTTERQVTAYFQSTIARLANLSTRMQVLTGNDVMIGGFVVDGTQPKTLVVRARGPSLAAFGISNPLGNPTLSIVRSADQQTIATNDDYVLAPNVAQLNASGYAPSNAYEPAVLTTFAPGAYTAIVSGAGGTTGLALVEVFEVDAPDVPLVNISTRGQVLTGDSVMIGGFVIQGASPQTVVVRARGPSLVAFGITNALANPTLQLVRSSDQAVLATNDDWQSATNAPDLDASGFAPSEPLESAILMTLPPGAYTAIVSGVGNTTGVGIVEVFAQ